MKAIKVTYKGPTNSRGSRLIVSDGDNRITVPFDYSLNTDERYEDAANKFMKKMNWTGKLVHGTFKDEEIFVFTPEVRS